MSSTAARPTACAGRWRRTAARRKARQRRAKPQRTRALDSVGDGDAYGELGRRGEAAFRRFNGEGRRRLPSLGKMMRPVQPVRKNGRGRRGNGEEELRRPSSALFLARARWKPPVARRFGRRPVRVRVLCALLSGRAREGAERERERAEGGEGIRTRRRAGFWRRGLATEVNKGGAALLCESGRRGSRGGA